MKKESGIYNMEPKAKKDMHKMPDGHMMPDKSMKDMMAKKKKKKMM